MNWFVFAVLTLEVLFLAWRVSVLDTRLKALRSYVDQVTTDTFRTLDNQDTILMTRIGDFERRYKRFEREVRQSI